MKWYFRVLKNYFNFKGRARRREFWLFELFNYIITIALVLIDSYVGFESIFIGLYILGTFIPHLAVSVRRLHDIGMRGWWLLLNFIPIIGPLITLVFYCMDSEAEENKFGTNPKDDTYSLLSA